MFHEMAHALGFSGGHWVDEGDDSHFTGELAIDRFDGAGGEDYDGEKVPVQLRVYSHWRESVACFDDPNGDVLSYSATSSNTGVATVSASGPNITFAAVLPGSAAMVTVTARNPEGLTAQQTFGVEVLNPDRAMLAAIYDALGGSGWITSTNWKTDASLDTWYGVTTNETGS